MLCAARIVGVFRAESLTSYLLLHSSSARQQERPVLPSRNCGAWCRSVPLLNSVLRCNFVMQCAPKGIKLSLNEFARPSQPILRVRRRAVLWRALSFAVPC